MRDWCSIRRASTSTPTVFWSRARHNGQGRQPEGLVPGAAGVPGGRLLGDPAVDDGRELFDAGYVRQQPVLLERRRLVQGTARSLERSRLAFLCLALAQPVLLRRDPRDRSAARYRGCAVDAAAGLERCRLPRDPRAATSDPVERGWHDLADLWPPRHWPAGLHAEPYGDHLQLRLR